MKKLLVVDKKDRVLRLESKEKCHRGKGILHRAFSVYIFNDKNQLLIQQRSKFKKLWPFYWANSCCSHIRKGEDYLRAGERRLKEELGFTCPLKLVDKFQYQAKYKNIGSENEICAILIGRYNGKEKTKKNPQEVKDVKWVNVEKLKKDFNENPQKYAPWFKIGLRRYLKIIERKQKNKKRINLLLEKTAEKINPVMRELLRSYVDKKFHELIDYQISTGGKRLRPALTVISSNLFRGNLKDVLYPAAGLEILHNCTLIIDDIIDHGKLRRNKSTVWFKFGKSMAECMGLDYLAAAFQGANRSKKPAEVSEIFAKTVKILVNGEILDILFEQRGREEEPYIAENRYQKIGSGDYSEMIAGKTASLFQNCCQTGGICAGADRKQVEALKSYGFNFGMIFQITDDILDIFGKEKDFGKKIGKDIEERKLGNIVILFALKELSKPDKDKILRIFRKKEIKNKDIKEVFELIKETNSYSKAGALTEKFVEKAKANLKNLPQNKWNKVLENLVDFVAQRDK